MSETIIGRENALDECMQTRLSLPRGTLDWLLVGGFVLMIALFAGAQSVPAFGSIISNIFFKINGVVRGLIG